MSNPNPILERHPKSLAMPEPSAEEILALRRSLNAYGWVPELGTVMVVDNRYIIDGWHKYAEATALGIPVPIEHYAGQCGNPAAYVWASAQGRALTAAQQVKLFAALFTTTPKLVVDIADGADVSETTVRRVMREDAPATETPSSEEPREEPERPTVRLSKKKTKPPKGDPDKSKPPRRRTATKATPAGREVMDKKGNRLPPIVAKAFVDAGAAINSALEYLHNFPVDDVERIGSVNSQSLDRILKDADDLLRAGMPHALCGICAGTLCDTCGERGWVTKMGDASIAATMKASQQEESF